MASVSKNIAKKLFKTLLKVFAIFVALFFAVSIMASITCYPYHGGCYVVGLRAISTEANRYVTAITAFHDKYDALPGDMENATELFGKGAANGNGDDMIDASTPETFQFWRQLALAKLIEGNYTGASANTSTMQWKFGKNTPVARLTLPWESFWEIFNPRKTGWSITTLNDQNTKYAGDDITYAGKYGLVLVFGGLSEVGQPGAPILPPVDAWNIDTKLDDGKPATGSVRARNWRECTTSTSNTDMDGQYKLESPARSCALYFLTGY